MIYTLKIKRQKAQDTEPYIQSFEYETEDDRATVATALTEINNKLSASEQISWECSCLQKKCGACAMVINGRPGLACDAFLCALGQEITVAPLSKFPTVRDLIVDRSVLHERLTDLMVWREVPDAMQGVELSGNAGADQLLYHNDKAHDMAYEASRCLQCGCCIEVCPNCSVDGSFYGAAAYVPNARVVAGADKSAPDDRDRRSAYSRHVYAGCGKSLSCQDICPAGIDIDRLLSKSNAAVIWGRNINKRK